jgi:hypothetical protein
MNTIKIELESGQTAFMPGETISGIATWNLEKRPTHIELRLFWYTSGKGTPDTETVEAISLEHPKQSDSHNFEIALPDGPYSFSGTLISLIWAIELIVEPQDFTDRTRITLSPSRDEIELVNYEEIYEEEDEELSLERAVEDAENIQA